MRRSVVVVPNAPLLLPEYTGREDAGAELRGRAAAEIDAAADVDGTDRVVLVVATDREQRGSRPPLGQRVGAHLADLAGVGVAGVVTVAWDAPTEECVDLGRLLADQPPVTLVVVADGSARRGEKAPGHLDERAAPLDEEIVRAVRDADVDALLALDPEVCAELLVHGRAPLQVAAEVLRARGDARCASVEASDPFGVLYLLARLESGVEASRDGGAPAPEGGEPAPSS